MDLGWQGLTAGEQQAAIYGGVIGGGSVMATYALFGWRWLRRPKRKRRSKRGRR
jgi:hypothetical protein